MQVFLTGATGFIGGPLVNALLVRGHRVIALVRDPASAAAQALQADGAELVVGDVSDREVLRTAMTGADMVLHAAGHYELGLNKAGRARMTQTNVNGTANTLGIAHELRVKRILYVSTAFVFGQSDGRLRDETWVRSSPPQSHYEATKSEAHELALALQRAGAPLVIACPVAVIGPGDHSNLGRLARLYVRNLLPPVSFGEGTVSFVHREDAVAGLLHCLERGQLGETYLLSGGALPVREVFKIWRTTPGGLQFIWWWMPRWWAVRYCAVLEPLQRLFGQTPLFSADLARIAFMDLQFSGAKAEQDLQLKFRSPRQAWLDTLAGERRALLGLGGL